MPFIAQDRVHLSRGASIFITDWKNYAAINEIYAEFFPGDKPARFCIQCGLVKPDALVEIATIAHIAK